MEPCWRSDGGFLTHFFLSHFVFYSINFSITCTLSLCMDLSLALVLVIFACRKNTPNGSNSNSNNIKWVHSFHVIDSIFHKRPNSFDFDPAKWICHIFSFFSKLRQIEWKSGKSNETNRTHLCVFSHRPFDRLMVDDNSWNKIEWFLEFVSSKIVPTPRVNRLYTAYEFMCLLYSTECVCLHRMMVVCTWNNIVSRWSHHKCFVYCNKQALWVRACVRAHLCL